MRHLNAKVIRTPCIECGGDAMKTNWLPPAGYDPYLRQFRCVKCGLEIYVAVVPGMTRTDELALLGTE